MTRASRPATAKAVGAVRRAGRQRRRRAGLWPVPIISPYVDRLAAAAAVADGHRCLGLWRLP